MKQAFDTAEARKKNMHQIMVIGIQYIFIAILWSPGYSKSSMVDLHSFVIKFGPSSYIGKCKPENLIVVSLK